MDGTEQTQSDTDSARRFSLAVAEDRARHFMGRPCYDHGTPLPWSVCGSYADGSGGGVLAWCYDKCDALEAKAALAATGWFVSLSIEHLA